MAVTIKGFDKLADNLTAYSERIEAGIAIVANEWARQAQDYAQENRRWQDRTGNARAGLRGFIEAERGKGVKIFLTTQMEYGVQLEIGHGGRYAIILPTISAKLSDLRRALSGIGS